MERNEVKQQSNLIKIALLQGNGAIFCFPRVLPDWGWYCDPLDHAPGRVMGGFSAGLVKSILESLG